MKRGNGSRGPEESLPPWGRKTASFPPRKGKKKVKREKKATLCVTDGASNWQRELNNSPTYQRGGKNPKKERLAPA